MTHPGLIVIVLAAVVLAACGGDAMPVAQRPAASAEPVRGTDATARAIEAPAPARPAHVRERRATPKRAEQPRPAVGQPVELSVPSGTSRRQVQVLLRTLLRPQQHAPRKSSPPRGAAGQIVTKLAHRKRAKQKAPTNPAVRAIFESLASGASR